MGTMNLNIYLVGWQKTEFAATFFLLQDLFLLSGIKVVTLRRSVRT